MNKRKITNIRTTGTGRSTIYDAVLTSIGGSTPSDHPQRKTREMMGISLKEIAIKEGDLVRCDGLLFSSRPHPLQVTLQNCTPYSKGVVKVAHYNPVNVGKNFWVLRKAA